MRERKRNTKGIQRIVCVFGKITFQILISIIISPKQTARANAHCGNTEFLRLKNRAQPIYNRISGFHILFLHFSLSPSFAICYNFWHYFKTPQDRVDTLYKMKALQFSKKDGGKGRTRPLLISEVSFHSFPFFSSFFFLLTLKNVSFCIDDLCLPIP